MPSGSPLQVGDVVAGSYVVEKVIGAGGMAYVALAAHNEQRHRVAIKILRPENSRKSEVVKRFEREQRTLTMLHSEHTLRIYGYGQHAGLPYMLVEYLQGKDLGELIKDEGPLPVERAVEYLLQSCHALAEAHLLGVVHRDLKPGNLFLTRRTDGSPCIKVLDFGISKVSHDLDALGEPSLVTKAHAVMGSPFYMSPEQMLSSTNVDVRSDIWSLGVTLFELLTKSLPFAADSATAVCRRIMSDEPTPLRKLRPSYPKGLEDVLSRCLQKRPERRFANVADLAVRLEEFGPTHSRYAVNAICELVQVVEPYARHDGETRALTLPLPGRGLASEAGATTGEVSSTSETVYLPHGSDERGGVRTATLLAATTFAFGLGIGLGWALNLETDPTKGALATANPRPAVAAQSSSPMPTAASGTGVAPSAPTPTSDEPMADAPTKADATVEDAPIDLDGGTRTPGEGQPARRRPSAEAATPSSASPKPEPPAQTQSEVPKPPPAASVKAPTVPNVTF